MGDFAVSCSSMWSQVAPADPTQVTVSFTERVAMEQEMKHYQVLWTDTTVHVGTPQ